MNEYQDDYEDGPISEEDSQLMAKLYTQYQERVKQLSTAQQEQHKRDLRDLNSNVEALQDIGRRKQ